MACHLRCIVLTGIPARPAPACRLHTPIDSQTVAWDVWSSLEIMKEVTRSLIFLHDHRILHGDLKAANVLLTSSSVDRRKYIAKVGGWWGASCGEAGVGAGGGAGVLPFKGVCLRCGNGVLRWSEDRLVLHDER